jgi:hypothetical protein
MVVESSIYHHGWQVDLNENHGSALGAPFFNKTSVDNPSTYFFI